MSAKNIENVEDKKVGAEVVESANERKYTWRNVEFTIKHTMSFADFADFTTGVVDLCTDDETGEYIPGLKDFAIRIFIVEKYTDFILPEDIEQRYDMLYTSDIVDFIVDKINKKQLDLAVDAIIESLNILNNNAMNEQLHRVKELIESVSELAEMTGAIFEGVTKDDVAIVMSALKDGKIDEKKLVDAYLERTGKEE